jgi:hypothetical protein
MTCSPGGKVKAQSIAASLFALVIIAGLRAQPSDALSPGSIDIMPAKYASGGNVVDYGLHYDDGRTGAYDHGFSEPSAAWLRGMVSSAMPYVTRYAYWRELSIPYLVRARMQVMDPFYPHSFLWVYDRDVEILHLGSMPSSVSYTQNVQNPGEWLYATVGVSCYCGTTELHAHLGVYTSSIATVRPKADDTCWANGSECNAMGGVWVKAHLNGSTCPPGTWSGTAWNRSGGVLQPYLCQTWSERWRTDGTPVFRVTF